MSITSAGFTLLRLIQPSWHGGLFTVILAISTIAAIAVPAFYEGSLVDTYFDTAISDQTGVFSDYTRLSQAIETSDTAGDVAVFLFWALVGIALYSLLLSITGAATNTIHFIQLFEYFKADRKRLETEALTRLFLRLSAIVGLYSTYKLFISTILPYVLYLTHKSLFVSPIQGAWNLFLACVLLVLATHSFVVLVRLMLLRYRVFRNTDVTIYN